MYKLLIADDEPLVRKGLYNTLEWDKFNIAVVDMAVNGKEALEISKREVPDICLLDINMPIINGLNLIEKIKEINPEVVIIIVTGYDEFQYAQMALKLKAFDYLLKPVYEEDLRVVIERALTELEAAKSIKKRYEWANEQLKKNLPILKSKFISDWLKGELSREEILEQLEFHKIELGKELGIVLLKLRGEALNSKSGTEWDRQLLLFAIQNIFEEILLKAGSFNIIRDDNDIIIALLTIKDKMKWNELKVLIESNVERYLNQLVTVYRSEIKDKAEDIAAAYEEIKKEIYNESCYLPIIRKVKHYMDRNYKDPELSLQKIANELEINSSYLSTLFKQEVGQSFTDYMIKIRITEAIRLMNDPRLKIYEIAEQVGYSSQHYFCNAFKKVLGISPSEYKQKNI